MNTTIQVGAIVTIKGPKPVQRSALRKAGHRRYQFWRDFDDLERNGQRLPRGSGRRYRPPDIDQALYE